MATRGGSHRRVASCGEGAVVLVTVALDRWDEHTTSWITLAMYATKAEARARAFELRLRVWRVREIGAASYECV